MSNYVDDWLRYSNDLEDLCERWEEFLDAHFQHNITLNTNKTKVGYLSA